MDGDTYTDESIAQSNLVTGTILNTSEFSLGKWGKGNLAIDFSKASNVTVSGDIVCIVNVPNNQDRDLKNIETVDILPYVGDTGVILNTISRGSQFEVYTIAGVTAKIINVLGDPVVPTPVIKIEYSTSKIRCALTKTAPIRLAAARGAMFRPMISQRLQLCA